MINKYIKLILITVAVISTLALTGCNNIEMTVDTSPGPETPDDYDVNVTEPITGEVFGDMYCIGQTGHGNTITYIIPNTSEIDRLHEIHTIRYGESDDVPSNFPREEEISSVDKEYRARVDAPWEEGVKTYRYGLKAYNESGQVIDAVNITVSEK